jgi:hypothetical protein
MSEGLKFEGSLEKCDGSDASATFSKDDLQPVQNGASIYVSQGE